jgi:L-serine dehydratase
MAISVFDIFKVGVGPSSSHTFGPMVAANRFLQELHSDGQFADVADVRVQLFGSLGLTGRGHYTDLATMLGLEGNAPETLDSAAIPAKQQRIVTERTLHLAGRRFIPFDPATAIGWRGDEFLPKHPNALQFSAHSAAGRLLKQSMYYSIGGGFVVGEREPIHPSEAVGDQTVPFPYKTGTQLQDLCERTGQSVSAVVRANERTWRTDAEITAKLLQIAGVMEASIQVGLHSEGEIPGGLRVKRMAKTLFAKLPQAQTGIGALFQLADNVMVYALAVMEVNATLGQVVTAPTMGSAGIVPAVLKAYQQFVPDATDAGVCDFLLAAGGTAIPVKINASFSGAEVGCQGEVGVACLMAACGLCAAVGGTPQQVLNAGAMALEHNLGLTCDPVGGLVQVPCIERNALAATKAINAVRLTGLQGKERTKPTFDEVVRSLYLTGKDMSDKYKETSRGGLAVTWVSC